MIRLEENYRSVSSVVDSALAVISQNPGQERKLHAVKRDGEKVRIVEASGEMAQAIFAAKEINRQIGGIDMLDIENSFERETERRQRRFSDICYLQNPSSGAASGKMSETGGHSLCDCRKR